MFTKAELEYAAYSIARMRWNEDNKLCLEILLDDVTELRRRHHYLIRALPAIGDDASGARIRSNVRARMTELAKDIRELRSQIREE